MTSITFRTLRTITVRREFTVGTYQTSTGEISCLRLKRNCGIGCTCEADITSPSTLTPTPDLATKKSLCFNDSTKQGISEIPGTATPIIEGPDVWAYYVQAEIIQEERVF